MTLSIILESLLEKTDIGNQICNLIPDINIRVMAIPNTIICENGDSKLLLILDNPSQDKHIKIQELYFQYRTIYIIQDWPSTEMELIQLYIENQIRYVQTLDNEDTVKQVVQFVENFKKPKATVKSLTRSTLKQSGNYKKTWRDLLQSIQSVSSSTSDVIIEKYPTMQCLLNKYSEISPEDGKKLLKDITLSNGRKFGPILSTKIYNVLYGVNPRALVYRV